MQDVSLLNKNLLTVSFCFPSTMLALSTLPYQDKENKDRKQLATRCFFIFKETIIMTQKNKEELSKGGRPPADNGRTKIIAGRFTIKEVEQINGIAKLYNLSKTELIRSKLLENIEPTLINGAEFTKELRSIGTEIAHIGNNINQLAKHANSLAKVGAMDDSVINRFNVYMNIYNNQSIELNTLLRKIIRISSKRVKNDS